MAAHTITNLAVTVVAWYDADDAEVKVSVNNGTATTAFALAGESPLHLDYDKQTGRLWLTYLSALGVPLRRSSDDNGTTWSAAL